MTKKCDVCHAKPTCDASVAAGIPNNCPDKDTCQCSELLVTCEECEKQGCPVCDEGWRNDWYHDESGIWFCPDCHKKMVEEYNRDTKNGTETCETCAHFDLNHEDADPDDSIGYCHHHQEPRVCREYCNERAVKTLKIE
jgi:hypothetical protein